MLKITFFDLVELLFVGFIAAESLLVKKIAQRLRFFHNFKSRFKVSPLKLDQKIHKNLIVSLSESEFFANFPELFSKPAGNR